MSTSTIAGKFSAGEEPIPGYVLRERIGSGGYGEVWKASAPGDLIKAIKIVYGTANDRCAARELKSLNRVKSVQHPFLLSIERIEIVENRLMIVTEFAESCLKRRFLECRNKGLPGIPRAELLGYLKDTADALDFIRDNYRLQHLDVKPENLLLNGGHVKVADFGLLKDLEDTKVSLVAGLTPLYAPPELFDGRPDLNSDQYSLAIVFQEMLTGEPPYSGRTTAQLAAQHLKSPPVLAPLPSLDQPIVGKALSKEPERRFPSCGKFVTALLEAHGSASAPVMVSRRSPGVPGEVEKDGGTEDLQARNYQGKLVQLPDLPSGGEQVANRPTVVIGVGGLGTAIVQKLRSRLTMQLGRLDEVPCIQLLVVDTDVKALVEAARGSGPSVLRDQETVAIPLRPSSEYRCQSSQLLSWINRRWLFNIPRSLKTESIRPLGRLALVDHWKQVANRLRVALMSAVSHDSIQTSAKQNIEFQPTSAPRIFIVGATSGGTASGLMADLAFGLRSLMDELHMTADQVCGLFVHLSGRNSQARDVALANSYVCMKEIEHYSAPGYGYPGDHLANIPARYQDHQPFSHLYFAHLGDELNSDQVTEGVELVSEYLFRSTLGASAEFLDRARDTEVKRQGQPLARRHLRTFGMYSFGGVRDELLSLHADELCRRLWMHALGENEVANNQRAVAYNVLMRNEQAASPQFDPELIVKVRQQSDAWATELNLNPSFWHELTDRITLAHFGGQPDEVVREIIDQLVATGRQQSPQNLRNAVWEDKFGELDVMVGLTHGNVGTKSVGQTLADDIHRELASHTRSRCETLRQYFGKLLDSPDWDLAEIQCLGRQFRDEVAFIRSNAEDECRGAANTAQRIMAEWMNGPAPGDKNGRGEANDPHRFELIASTLLEYVESRVIQMQRRSIAGTLLQIENTLGDMVDRLRLSITQLRNRQRDRSEDSAESRQSWAAADHAHIRRVKRLWQLVKESCQRSDTPLAKILLSHGRELDWFSREVEGIARTLTYADWRNAVGDEEPQGNSSDGDSAVLECVAQSLPKISSCGGGTRFLLIGPESAQREKLTASVRSRLAGALTVLNSSQSPVVLCCELEQVPMRNVTGSLLMGRFDLIEVAGRLRTRTDVDWNFLK